MLRVVTASVGNDSRFGATQSVIHVTAVVRTRLTAVERCYTYTDCLTVVCCNIQSQRGPVSCFQTVGIGAATHCLGSYSARVGVHNGIDIRKRTAVRVPCTGYRTVGNICSVIVGGTAGGVDKVVLLVEDFEHKTRLLGSAVVHVVEHGSVFEQKNVGVCRVHHV